MSLNCINQRKAGADHHVGGGEAFSEPIGRSLAGSLAQDGDDGVIVGPAGRRPRRRRPVHRLVEHRRLDAARHKEEPLEVGAAQLVRHCWCQTGLRVGVGEIAACGGDFADDRVAVNERRHLAHGVEGQILGLALVAVLEVQQLHFVRFANLLEHPHGHRGSRRRRVIEFQPRLLFLGHVGLLLQAPSAGKYVLVQHADVERGGE